MKITALDIRQKTFEKSFRGVDKEEVHAFLNTVSQQWERLGDENRELRLKLEHAQQDVHKMREVESSLYRTLKTAEDTGNNITEQAQRDAALRVREAQLQAEQLLGDARQQARAVVDEAYRQAEKTVAEMQYEASSLGQECQHLEQQLDGLVRDLHHLASDALEKVEKARHRPKSGTATILSRAARVQVERPKESVPHSIPEPTPVMQVSTAPAMSPAAVMAAPASFAPERLAVQPATYPAPDSHQATPATYNPKPGQQPEPGTAPGPDIERPAAPAENPGIAPAPYIEQPEPSQVPHPGAPHVDPMAPDIRPIGPDRPEITQPQPMTHPGMATTPAPAPTTMAEKSFFDEI